MDGSVNAISIDWPELESSSARFGVARVNRVGEPAMSGTALPSDDLVTRILSGDRSAEEALVRHYFRGVRALLKHGTRTTDDAEDLCQDTFLTVISKIRRGDLRDPAKLSAFVHGVARNLALAQYRAESMDRPAGDVMALERIAAEMPGPFEIASQEQATALLRVAIESLPVERDRTLMKRHFFAEASVEQLCKELATDRVQFSRIKHRATRRLIELLREKTIQ